MIRWELDSTFLALIESYGIVVLEEVPLLSLYKLVLNWWNIG